MNIEEKMISLRREFHKIAEAGWFEFQTTIKIIDYLKSYGYEVKYGRSIHSERRGVPPKKELQEYANSLQIQKEYDISEILQGYTGVVATLDTGNPGPTIAMRFDIDANDVEETKDESHIPTKEGFVSENTRFMHACGHDGHISIGLTIAEWIMNNKEDLKGEYVLIFQPGEEGSRGARSMVGAGVLDGVDYFLSGHIGMGVEKDVLAVGVLGFLATTKMDVYFTGEPAHAGAAPEEGKNALLAAASCALNLHTLPQFAAGMSRLNVGTIVAGTGRNVVPPKAKLQIETRGENEVVNNLLEQKVDKVIKGSALAYDVEYSVDIVGGAPSYPNYDDEFINEIKDFLEEKDYNVIVGTDLGASEDVTYMLNAVEEQGGRTAFFMFGTNLKAGHHNNKFDFDEDVLPKAYNTYIDAIKMLSERAVVDSLI